MRIGLKQNIKWCSLALGIAVAVVALVNVVSYAQEAVKRSEGFALQVSPATLIETIKPGEQKTMDLKIENQSVNKEHLKIELREIKVDKESGEISLLETEPVGIKDWATFSHPTFTLESGEAIVQKITIAMPKEAGFAYSFALVISRVVENTSVNRGAVLSGSVAVFSLVAVDKPGATRSFEIEKVSVPSINEYLPVEIAIQFRNTGNTFVQPAGNIFIQRGSDDAMPIATIPVNEKRGFLLPGAPRTITATWEDGFPAYRVVTDPDGQQRKELVWDWTKITDFRIGRYVAKVVAVYNDGQRDVPVVREVSFWVIPWRAILFLVAVITLIVLVVRKLVQQKVQKAVKQALSDHGKENSKQHVKKKK